MTQLIGLDGEPLPPTFIGTALDDDEKDIVVVAKPPTHGAFTDLGVLKVISEKTFFHWSKQMRVRCCKI